jgi:hypothetical protein
MIDYRQPILEQRCQLRTESLYPDDRVISTGNASFLARTDLLKSGAVLAMSLRLDRKTLPELRR